MFLDKTCNNVFEKQYELPSHTRFDISKDVIKDVCMRYMKEFDCCVATHRARAANEIRAHLIDMLKTYHSPLIEDTGDIAVLRNIVYSI